MSWKDRIKEMAITTPDGQRYIAEFENVERTAEKKTSDYQFSDTEGTLVQDFGVGKIDYPMIVYFSGENYDLTAKAFFLSALKKGNSILESPVYGQKTVVIKSINQSDSPASAGNQAVFNLAMTETIVIDVPIAATLEKAGILSAQENFIQDNAGIFNEEFNGDNVIARNKSKNRFLQFTKGFGNIFKNAIKSVSEINDTFTEIDNFITNNIDTLMGAPLELATAVQRLMLAPARVQQSVKSRIEGYTEAYDKMLNPSEGEGTADTKNQKTEKQLFLTGLLSGMSEVYLFPGTPGFLTKNDAVESALNLANLYGNAQDFLDNEQRFSLNDLLGNRFVVSDVVTQGIKNITSQTSKNLIRLSFSLKQEKIIFLDKWYNLFDLCFKLYGSSQNDIMDFLIETNRLSGEELIKVPVNRKIVYYE